MKARALVGTIVFGTLFALLLTLPATQARGMPEEPALLASLEVWSNFQPAGWVKNTPVTCMVDVQNDAGFTHVAGYNYSTDGGSAWSGDLPDVQIESISPNTVRLTAASLPFPHSTSGNQNQIKFTIQDPLGVPMQSDPYPVRVDTAAPTSAGGTSGCYSTTWPGEVGGEASDVGSGVSVVELTLRRMSDSRYYSGSSWQPASQWLAAGTVSNWAQWYYPFTPGEDAYEVESRSTDAAGNQQVTFAHSSFTYDVTPPQSAIGTTGAFRADTWPHAISGSASDSLSGVTSVRITLQRALDNLYYDGTAWGTTATWLPVSGTVAWSLAFTPPVESVYTVSIRAVDNCGNAPDMPAAASFIYDATAPSSPFSLSVTPSAWSMANSFTVTWTNPSDLSGITRAHFKWDDDPATNPGESPGSPVSWAGIQSMSGLGVPRQGTHVVYLWLEDAAGNTNVQTRNATGRTFRWDATAPLSTITGITGTQGCTGWYTSTVQVTLNAADVNPSPGVIDAISGISSTWWRKDGGVWQRVTTSTFSITGEGQHTVEYYSTDVAGNRETSKVLTPAVKIDTVPPTTSLPSYTGTMGRNGWYTSTVSVGLTAVDATSGLATIYHQVDADAFRPGSVFDVTADGEHTVRYYSVDNACNQEAVQTASAPLRIDKTAPGTSYRLDGLQGNNGWFLASPVTVTLFASDAITGIQTSGMDKLLYRVDGGSWQPYSRSFTAALQPGQREDVQTIEYYATDLAGNVEPRRVLTVSMDTFAPLAINHIPIVSPNGWTKTNCFTITWDENPLDLSGIGGAYYSFDAPLFSTDGTLVPGDNIMSIPCINVPVELGDGAHDVYLWLRDRAGNTDYQTARTVTVRLDQTPPTVTPLVAGSSCGTAGWYNSCVTVTFVATDNVRSGMVGGVISYQVNGGGWVPGTSYSECREGRYTIECRAMDAAGNVSNITTTMVKEDRTAPPAPISLRVEPSGWFSGSCFTLGWLNPGDLSGLAGLYYKLGSPPLSSVDGTFVDGAQSSLVVCAAAEGEAPLYVWLVDRACNSDHQKRATATLKYDHTPPSTTFSASGAMGEGGWYVSPVQITTNCQDGVGASGCARTRYLVGSGPWQEGTSFLIDGEGVVPFSYHSVDNAGNAETVHTGSVRMDQQPPDAYAYADSYSRSCSFTVHWNGSDASSGIAAFDVQYRIGASGEWHDWEGAGGDPSQTSKLFRADEEECLVKAYYFRARARDKAGNVGRYPDAAQAYVFVDPLVNGDFESGGLTGWASSWMRWPAWQGTGECRPQLVITQSHSGGSTHAVVLGCPDLKHGAPVGASMIVQTLNVPPANDVPAPTLYFRYHIVTYDVLQGQVTKKLFDSLNVSVCPVGQLQATCVFTDAVFMDGSKTGKAGELTDLGWQEGMVDLRPYAGKTVQVCLANATREDVYYNTWTVIDDLRLANMEHKVRLPAVLRAAAASGQFMKALEDSHSASGAER